MPSRVRAVARKDLQRETADPGRVENENRLGTALKIVATTVLVAVLITETLFETASRILSNHFAFCRCRADRLLAFTLDNGWWRDLNFIPRAIYRWAASPRIIISPATRVR